MCGINGIVRVDSSAPPVDVTELLRTRDAMSTRGPDGAGLWLSPTQDAGLGHRRLAIIDLSEAGAQPMVSPDGRYVVVFNGEIYNYRELRAELLSAGQPLVSHSDTEVLLTLYALEGPEMLGRLRGMFAFAIWDEKDKRLFAARDTFGIKPFYYSAGGATFRFASQVKALEQSGAVPLDVDPAGLCGFLLWGSVPEPFTLRRAIKALPAGCWMAVSPGGVEGPRPYARPTDASQSSAVDVAKVLDESVVAHLVSDVPVGVFLSAGLDSALLTALMRRHLAEPPLTFTLAFDEFQGTPQDEAPGAMAIARALGCRHVERRINSAELASLWPRALQAMDQPSIDGFNVFVVSHCAREAGLKVVLSGLGGDELFGSYPSFHDVPLWRSWARLGSRVPGLSGALQSFARGPRPKLAGFVRYGATLPGAYFLRRGLFLPEELPRLLGTRIVAEGLETYDAIADARRHLTAAAVDDWTAVQLMESGQYLRNQLLRDADWASMAHSLELRVPLVDAALSQSLQGMGLAEIRKKGKGAAVRQAAPELPQEVFDRRKSGFMVPWAGALNRATRRPGAWGQQSRLLALEVLKSLGLRPELEA